MCRAVGSVRQPLVSRHIPVIQKQKSPGRKEPPFAILRGSVKHRRQCHNSCVFPDRRIGRSAGPSRGCTFFFYQGSFFFFHTAPSGFIDSPSSRPLDVLRPLWPISRVNKPSEDPFEFADRLDAVRLSGRRSGEKRERYILRVIYTPPHVRVR